MVSGQMNGSFFGATSLLRCCYTDVAIGTLARWTHVSAVPARTIVC